MSFNYAGDSGDGDLKGMNCGVDTDVGAGSKGVTNDVCQTKVVVVVVVVSVRRASSGGGGGGVTASVSAWVMECPARRDLPLG